ncbi:MAG: 3-octaprenyl-4-hydroxybenzoate carboxy-lyase [Bacteroidetes bacterium RIFOXYA12_FULL_35_11]|nr:MAG: 3-octaprenyl-4-hydroxybenzoate carboxy-lyase [Bacteroidetes bacterium GWF2_35_48]OFY80193.1 MAG: 3-octaprenyl-4-hydroxybenzoate carboxy-lyase [Bacteroidetes bacterium RIFOXYA12_FULL_35_11]OFY93509.1 MAG: 3-octaprenyl-4-hydroxybenzoate carboxy-lyase [Bacteroidetes bacterium RIFOXYC12_FULL_35_7]HBX51727.1 3-octaprenyl-4-hydroxybenzoate carboxy-lyase [Bacteroidales bacterium]
MNPKQKIILAITGASGSIYGKILLETLTTLSSQVEKIELVFSEQAEKVWEYELESKFSNSSDLISIYKHDDFYAPFASGSSKYDTMIICPCSMGTLGRIASGISNDLITRAADVMLKERRRLILVTRESPLSLIHINNMKTITEAGGIIFPASPSFYSKPDTIEALVKTITDRVLAMSGIETNSYEWGQ